MKTFEQLAREAYEIYATQFERIGKTLISWDDLLPFIKDAKIAATRYIVEQAKEVH